MYILCLDYTSDHVQDIAVDVHKAKRLARAGQELMLEYKFTKEQLEQKCLELRSLYRKLELIFTEKRQSLLKFLELYQTLDMVTKVRWIREGFQKKKIKEFSISGLTTLPHRQFFLGGILDHQ